jgi:hypothetical protein
MEDQIQKVYAELGRVLDNPKSFGLGPRVPQALANQLKWMRGMLEEAIQQDESPPADEDLAVELSQDTDRGVL